MRKEPEMRYATAADLAAEVRRHLAREPVIARHPTLGYRAKCLGQAECDHVSWQARSS